MSFFNFNYFLVYADSINFNFVVAKCLHHIVILGSLEHGLHSPLCLSGLFPVCQETSQIDGS